MVMTAKAEEAGEQRDEVERRQGDERGDHAGAHQVDERVDAHHLEGVDLLADAHRAELGGEGRAAPGGQRDRRDDRGGLPDVHERPDQPHERLRADHLEAGAGLRPHLGAREQRHDEDDEDRAAADHGRPDADDDVADLQGHRLGVLQPEDDVAGGRWWGCSCRRRRA
jgi:hypothetical protein